MGRRPHPRFALQGRSIRPPSLPSPCHNRRRRRRHHSQTPFPNTLSPRPKPDPVRTPTSEKEKQCAPFVRSSVVCVCAKVVSSSSRNARAKSHIFYTQSSLSFIVVRATFKLSQIFFMKDMLNKHEKKTQKSRNTSHLFREEESKIEIGRTFTSKQASKQTSSANEIKTIFIKLHNSVAVPAIRSDLRNSTKKTASATAATTTAKISNKSASERERERKKKKQYTT